MILRTVLKFSCDRYLVAGQALVHMKWGFGPYSAAFIAVSALNAVNLRARSAQAAILMVIVQSGGMVLLAGPAGLDPIDATIASFLLASLLGMAWGLGSLSTALSAGATSPRPLWWLAPTTLVLLAAAIGLVEGPMSPLIRAYVSLGVGLLGTALVLSPAEVTALIRKAGWRWGIRPQQRLP